MMKNVKRIVSLLLISTILVTMFTACSSVNPNNIPSSITKGQWIEQLGAHFGLDNQNDNGPYFKDVSKDNAIYDYVQACVNWNIIKDGDKFKQNDKVNREYVFATAMRAIGEDVTGCSSDLSDKELAKASIKFGLADNSSWTYMHQGVDEEEGTKIAENASIAFCGQEIADHNNSKLKDNVKIKEDLTDVIVDTIDNKVTTSASNPDKYQVGDIVIFGSGRNIKQYKIKNVREENGNIVYDTEIPSFDEVYDNIDIGGIGVLEDVSDIHCAEGVTLTEVDGASLVNSLREVATESLGLANNDVNATSTKNEKGTNFKIDVSFGSDSAPKISASSDMGNGTASLSYNKKKNGDLSNYDIRNEKGQFVNKEGKQIDADTYKKYEDMKITEYKNGNKKTVTTGSEYKKGWRVSGSVEVTHLEPTVDVETKKIAGVSTGIKNFKAECNPEISANIGVEGYLSKEFTLVEVAFTAGGVLTLSVALKAKFEANGKFSFFVTVKTKNTITYDKKNGFKKVSSTETDHGLKFEATITVTPLKISVTVKIGWFSIIDFSISAAIELSVKLSGTYFVYSKQGIYRMGGDEGKLEDRQTGFLFCREYKLVMPIITMEIGSSATLAGKLGLSYKWKIMAEKGGLKKPPIILKAHCEGEFLNAVDKCTLDTLEPYQYENLEEAKEDENYEEITEKKKNFEVDSLALEVFKGSNDKIKINSIPNGYSIGDVVASSSNDSVVSIVSIKPYSGLGKVDADKGYVEIKGVDLGTATVNVSLTDNKGKTYQQNVVVIVNERPTANEFKKDKDMLTKE